MGNPANIDGKHAISFMVGIFLHDEGEESGRRREKVLDLTSLGILHKMCRATTPRGFTQRSCSARALRLCAAKMQAALTGSRNYMTNFGLGTKPRPMTALQRLPQNDLWCRGQVERYQQLDCQYQVRKQKDKKSSPSLRLSCPVIKPKERAHLFRGNLQEARAN